MTSVSLYTSRDGLPPSEDDQHLASALRQRGATAEVVAWDDPLAEWSDIGVICSTWDYTTRFAEFSAWLQSADNHCTLINPLPVLQRSLDKGYLLELADAAVPTVPTRLTSDDPADIRAAAAEQGWEEVVLKPLVSAGGRHVLRGPLDNLPSLPPPAAGIPTGWLVQPLLAGIADGEYSCIFVEGELTHAVLKQAAANDFRVQASYGGRTTLSAPPQPVREVAMRALQVLALEHVYARVDVVTDPGLGAVIMEVEMVEPDLFLRFSETASQRLADAVLRRHLAEDQVISRSRSRMHSPVIDQEDW